MTQLPGRLVLLGHPVAHSKSPAFQNAALAAAGIPLTYEAVDVEPSMFVDVVRDLRHARASGNVTVPHKERMRDACDALTPLAERVGAVNTFWVDGAGQLVGDNTDVAGFSQAVALLLGASPHGLAVGVIGAGGSAAAVLAAVESWPNSSAMVFNRTAARARMLCERFSSVAQSTDDIREIGRAQLVVNATTIGLGDDSQAISPALLAPNSAAIDLVYRRGGTAWVRALLAQGRAAADGGAMLVEQGAFAFEKWFGVAPDRQVMWSAFNAL